MAVDLLTYANREKVAQALTARGYQVSRNTVNRWARGDEIPSIAALMIASLFGHSERAAPAIPERLDRIEALIRAIAKASGVDLSSVDAMYAEVLEELREQQRDAERRSADPRARDE